MPFKDFTRELFTAGDIDLYLMNQAIIVCTSVTRPGTPSVGMRVWETDTKSERVWDGSTWVFLKGQNFFARKTADETVISSASLQQDDHLIAVLPANSQYVFELGLIYNSSTSAELLINMNTSLAGFVGYGSSITETNFDSVTVNIRHTDAGNSLQIGGLGADVCVYPRGYIATGGTTSALQLLWSQVVSTASNTTIRAMSYMYCRKVG